MSIIHRTTVIPSKLDLLTAWLPAQPWYAGHGRAPELAKAGGFRLDDPQGEVGIEFLVATDAVDGAAYLVPMTYRPSALPGAELIGTMEHGVLGPRWAYDGLTDPVLVAQFVALVTGQAEPQAQSISDTADPTVTCVPLGGPATAAVGGSAVAETDPAGTELRVGVVTEDGSAGRLVITVNRVLRPDDAGLEHDPGAAAGRLSAGWRQADGTSVRGCLAVARYA